MVFENTQLSAAHDQTYAKYLNNIRNQRQLHICCSKYIITSQSQWLDILIKSTIFARTTYIMLSFESSSENPAAKKHSNAITIKKMFSGSVFINQKLTLKDSQDRDLLNILIIITESIVLIKSVDSKCFHQRKNSFPYWIPKHSAYWAISKLQ